MFIHLLFFHTFPLLLCTFEELKMHDTKMYPLPMVLIIVPYLVFPEVQGGRSLHHAHVPQGFLWVLEDRG